MSAPEQHLSADTVRQPTWSCPTCRQVFEDQAMMKLHATHSHFEGRVCACPNHDDEVHRLRYALAEMTEERDRWRALVDAYENPPVQCEAQSEDPLFEPVQQYDGDDRG